MEERGEKEKNMIKEGKRRGKMFDRGGEKMKENLRG